MERGYGYAFGLSAPYHNGKLASCFGSSRVTIHESLVTIPISATESGEGLESGVASVSK